MRRTSILWLLLILLITVSCGRHGGELRIGIIKPSIDHYPLSYAMAHGWLDDRDYTLVPFSSGWEAQEALISGRVDVAILPFTYVWNAASRGYPVRTVSFFERETDAVVVLPEIETPQDLDGRKVGVLKASTLDVLWREFAVREQVKCEVVDFRTPNEMIAALANKDISAAVLYVPLVQKLEQEHKVLHWFGDHHPAHPCCDLAININRVKGKRLEKMKTLYSTLDSFIARLDSPSDEMYSFLKNYYGLDQQQLDLAMKHTVFSLSLDAKGKQFQRNMALISRDSGYLERIPTDEEVYFNLHDH